MTPGTAPPEAPRTRGLTLLLYWGSLTMGFLLPWVMQFAVDVGHRGRAAGEFFDGLAVRLFGPESGLLLLSLLSAAPFVIYAVVTLLHLGTALRHGATVTRRRRFALLLALAAMLTVSMWGHYAILTARGSTAGIGFIFLPFTVTLATWLAYAIGRGIGRHWYR
jgi:hypothetical protein